MEQRYAWDPRLTNGLGAYRDVRTGRIVSLREVRAALDAVAENAGAEVRRLALALVQGEITLQAWQAAMADHVTNIHYATGALAVGGFAQLTQRHLAVIQEQVAFNLTRLREFAAAIASGRQRLDGRFLRRAEMYVQAGRTTYNLVQRLVASQSGFDEVKSVRTARDSCRGCLDEAQKGWQAIGEAVPIGQRDCLTQCRCYWIYRNAETGTTVRLDLGEPTRPATA